MRPEPFGALLYHFGTRRLSFLKDRRLLEVVERLDGSTSVDEALANVPEGERPAFRRALDENPDFIGQDAGSTDMGPYYHGSSKPFLPRATYKHDLAIMLKAAREHLAPAAD